LVDLSVKTDKESGYGIISRYELEACVGRMGKGKSYRKLDIGGEISGKESTVAT